MTQFEAIVKLTENSTKPISAYSPAYGWLTIKEVFTKDAPYHEIRCEINKRIKKNKDVQSIQD